MKALADYVHTKGLKLGIYSSPGPNTCAGYEGSYGHEEQDAKTWAAWGIDYLKYDWCGARNIYTDDEMQAVYQKMGDALRKSGPPDRLQPLPVRPRGRLEVGSGSGREPVAHHLRYHDSWDSMMKIGFSQSDLAQYAAPGHWNDPDMLEIGNGGMNENEYRIHMSLWSMLAAPLMAGNDLRSMKQEIKDILMNREVIAVDQDAAGKQARRVSPEGAQEDLGTRTRGRRTCGCAVQQKRPPGQHDGEVVGCRRDSEARSGSLVAYRCKGVRRKLDRRDPGARRGDAAPGVGIRAGPSACHVILDQGNSSLTGTIPDILARIVERKREELARPAASYLELEKRAEKCVREPRDFAAALRSRRPAIIAEIKQASPSKGVLSHDFQPAATARQYEAGGAAALSVLTDRDFFRGSLEDLAHARAAVALPVIRKDFTIDKLHVVEAAANGADAILLIAAILTVKQMRDFRELAARYGMASLVEVHDGEELAPALDSGAEIVGVNNRDLRTFQVSLETSLRLAAKIPSGVTKVSESGIRTAEDVHRLMDEGYHAFLVGEHLMKSGDPAGALRQLCS